MSLLYTILIGFLVGLVARALKPGDDKLGFLLTIAVGIGGSILPLAMTVALTGLEFLVAFLQAYVFTVLTCMYLNDAIHPGH